MAILWAATEEIAENGYMGLRVPAVAKRVGKTHGAVYGRYPNKEALALAAIRHLRDEVLLPKMMVAVSESGSAIQAVERVSATIAGVADDFPKGQLMFARLASELASDSSAIGEEVRALFATFARVLTELFERAKSDGELLPTVDPSALAYAVVGLPFAFSTVSTMFPDAARYKDLEATLSPVLTRGVSSS